MKIPTMQAVRYDGSGVVLDEVRRVRPATGQVLVRVSAVTIDRRDGEPLAGPNPMRLSAGGHRILGRHVVGTVAAPGAGVEGWPLGRPVALLPEAVVRHEWFIPGLEHDGGLADYVVAPVEGLAILPRGMPTHVSAGLPLAARAHSMLMRGRLRPGDSVGIWGVGSLGGSALAVAQSLGAAPIVAVDPSEQARALAIRFGADTALHPADPDLTERLAGLTAGRGLDLALHSAPDTKAAEQLRAALAPEGKGVFAGPAHKIGGIQWWDGRALSGPPRVAPDSLRRLAHLASHERLHLPVPLELPGGLSAAAGLLDAAARSGAPVQPRLLIL